MLHGLKKDLVEIIGFVSRIQRYRYDVRFMYLKIKKMEHLINYVCVRVRVCVCVCVLKLRVPGRAGVRKKNKL